MPKPQIITSVYSISARSESSHHVVRRSFLGMLIGSVDRMRNSHQSWILNTCDVVAFAFSYLSSLFKAYFPILSFCLSLLPRVPLTTHRRQFPLRLDSAEISSRAVIDGTLLNLINKHYSFTFRWMGPQDESGRA